MSKKLSLSIIVSFLYVLSIHASQELSKKSTGSMLCLSSDIAQHQIQQFLSLQDIGHLKQTSRICDKLFNAKKVCSSFTGCACETHACSILRNNYYACTKALGYCARTKNKDLFYHWWFYHEGLRNKDIALFLKRDYFAVGDHIHVYRKHYQNTEKVKKRMLEYVAQLLQDGNESGVITVLSQSNLTIFQLLDEIGAFKRTTLTDKENIIYHMCRTNNADFIHYICNGAITVPLLQYVMKYSSDSVVKELIEKQILSVDLVDKQKRTPLHFAVKYNHLLTLILLLEKGVNINSQDKQGRTALHFAAKYARDVATSILLKNDHLDIYRTDVWGKTARDYASSMRNILASDITYYNSATIDIRLQNRKLQDKIQDSLTYRKKGYHKL